MGQDTIVSTDTGLEALVTKVNNDFAEVFASLLAISAGSGVIVSTNDDTPGVLNGKLVAGTGMDFTENDDGSNETFTIAFGDSKSKEIEFRTFALSIM